MQLSFSSTFSNISICIHDFASAIQETSLSLDVAFVCLNQRGFLLFLPDDYIGLSTLPPLALTKKAKQLLFFDLTFFHLYTFSIFVQGLWKEVL